MNSIWLTTSENWQALILARSQKHLYCRCRSSARRRGPRQRRPGPAQHRRHVGSRRARIRNAHQQRRRLPCGSLSRRCSTSASSCTACATSRAAGFRPPTRSPRRDPHRGGAHSHPHRGARAGRLRNARSRCPLCRLRGPFRRVPARRPGGSRRQDPAPFRGLRPGRPHWRRSGPARHHGRIGGNRILYMLSGEQLPRIF